MNSWKIALSLLLLPSMALATTKVSKTVDSLATTGGSSLSLPSTGTTIVTDTNTVTLQNKTIDGSSLITTGVKIEDTTDNTKQLAFSLSGMTTAKTLTLSTSQTTTQTLSLPNVGSGDTVATLNATQTFASGSTWNGAVIGTTYGGVGTWQQDVFRSCNASLTAFTLSFTPAFSAGVVAYLDGTLLTQGSGLDYTTSGTTFTLASACAKGQRLIVVYEH